MFRVFPKETFMINSISSPSFKESAELSFSRLSNPEERRKLETAYQECSHRVSLCRKINSSIDARLYLMDPQSGRRRYDSRLKTLWNRIMLYPEVRYWRMKRDAIQEKLSASEEEIYRIEQRVLGPESVGHLTDPRYQLLLDFFGNMPIFQNYPALRNAISEHLFLPDDMKISLLTPDTLQIEAPQRIKAHIADQTTVSNEECQRLDPENPLLKTEEYIPLYAMRRFGSIDADWWGWIRGRHPCFGPRMIVQKDQNCLKFQAGVSRLSKVEFQPDHITFHAMWLQKSFKWSLDDFLLLLTKFREYPSS